MGARQLRVQQRRRGPSSRENQPGDRSIAAIHRYRSAATQAMRDGKGSFGTGVVEGQKTRPAAGEFVLRVPYGDKLLEGDDLLVQVEQWVRSGVIELDCGNAIATVVRTKKWLDLSDRCV